MENRSASKGRQDAGLATMDWLNWYNQMRLPRSIGNAPPAEARTPHHRQQVSLAEAARLKAKSSPGNSGRIAGIGVHQECHVLHPNQFQVNEAWIVFKLNDAPLPTKADGDLDFITMMDAASCFIVSTAPVSAGVVEPSLEEVKRLLREGHAHHQQWPRTLLLPKNQPAKHLTAEAERQGITVVRVSANQLMVFVGDAKEGFRQHFAQGSDRSPR